jgi:hypothetical protein
MSDPIWGGESSYVQYVEYMASCVADTTPMIPPLAKIVAEYASALFFEAMFHKLFKSDHLEWRARSMDGRMLQLSGKPDGILMMRSHRDGTTLGDHNFIDLALAIRQGIDALCTLCAPRPPNSDWMSHLFAEFRRETTRMAQLIIRDIGLKSAVIWPCGWSADHINVCLRPQCSRVIEKVGNEILPWPNGATRPTYPVRFVGDRDPTANAIVRALGDWDNAVEIKYGYRGRARLLWPVARLPPKNEH